MSQKNTNFDFVITCCEGEEKGTTSFHFSSDGRVQIHQEEAQTLKVDCIRAALERYQKTKEYFNP